MDWKILSSEYLFSDLWFKVRKDKCETPQGKIVDPYYVYEFPTWVTALALTEDGKVILERQYRHALGEICIEIPGGCVDDTDQKRRPQKVSDIFAGRRRTRAGYLRLLQT